MKPFFEKILKNLSSKSKYIEEKKSRNNSSQKQLLHKKKKEKVATKFKRVRTTKKLDLVLSYNLKQNGKFLIQQKDFKKALQELNTSIEHNNSDYEAFELRGIVKENLKDIEGAIKDFEQAIIWSDKQYQAKLKIELALLKFRNGASEESIFDLSKITKLYTNK